MSFGIPVRNGLGVGLLASTFLSTLRIGGRPAMFLNFIGTDSLDSRVTFTRASTATFVGSNGSIQSAAINTPRFDYDPVTLAPKGLLLEEARTNLMTYSESLDTLAQWGQNAVTVSANATTSPDGTTNADAIIPNTSVTAHNLSSTTPVLIGSTYAVSIFAKTSGYRYVSFKGLGLGGAGGAIFDLQNGVVVATNSWSSATIVAFPNGWYRLSAVGTATGLAGPIYCVYDNPNNLDFAGDGVSGVHMYGAQAEIGTSATSYIPNLSFTANTRNADVAQMTGTNFSSWYNQTEGTFVLSGDVISNSTNRLWMDVGPNGAFGTTAYISQNSSSISLLPGSPPVNLASTVVTAALSNNVAIALQNNNSVIAVGGVLGTVDAACAVPASATQLVIGSAIWALGSTITLNGHIRRIAYYNTRLPNATLQALTA